jgi:hypothetical protein
MVLFMKKQLKGIGLMCLLVMAAMVVNAQSGNSSFVVSKDVQRVANKKAFDNEDLRKSNITAQSTPYPAIVISKGIVRSNETEAQANIASKGYPTWAISKGVARQNQERIRKARASDEPGNGTLRGEEITRK